MPDINKSKYFIRGRSQHWKTWKFQILTPCARVQAYRHQKYILQFQKRFQHLGHMPQKCPCRSTNPLAPTVYLLQGGKVHPNFENQEKNFSENKIFSLHYDQKNTLNPLVKSVFARDSIYAKRAYAIAIPSVCLSVCLSVCHTGGSVKNGWS